MCVGIDYVRTVPFITEVSVLGYHSPCGRGGCAGISSVVVAGPETTLLWHVSRKSHNMPDAIKSPEALVKE
jgi:hypothetical protein